jgi:hypothetical protein
MQKDFLRTIAKFLGFAVLISFTSEAGWSMGQGSSSKKFDVVEQEQENLQKMRVKQKEQTRTNMQNMQRANINLHSSIQRSRFQQNLIKSSWKR